MSDQKCQQDYIRRIHKVQDYIQQHIAQSLSIEELSDDVGFSKYHFSRIFQVMLHEPLAHYVNRIRMEIENLEQKQVAYVRHTGTYETLAKEDARC